MGRPEFQDFVSRPEARIDDDLTKYFVETAALGNIKRVEEKPFLAIGIKGIGKTAAYKYLVSDREAIDVVQAIDAETQDPEDLPGGLPTLRYLPDIRRDLIYQALSTVVKLSKNKDSPVAKKCEKKDIESAKSLTREFWKKLKEKAKDFGGLTFLGCGFQINKLNRISRLRLTTRENQEKALGTLTNLCRNIRIRIVVDDPEALFSTSEQLNENLVAALVIAAAELNQRVHNLKIIILIKPNIYRALRRVDEFPNLPSNSSTKLFWSREELLDVVKLRADAADFDLSTILNPKDKKLTQRLLTEVRNGPRDLLRRFEIFLSEFSDGSMTSKRLDFLAEHYARSCYEQIESAYERQYPRLANFVLALFASSPHFMTRKEFRQRVDTVIATGDDLPRFKDTDWLRDVSGLYDLLIDFGLTALKVGDQTFLPYQREFFEARDHPEAEMVCLPALMPLIGASS